MTRASYEFQVYWPERTRSLTAPASARTGVFELKQGSSVMHSKLVFRTSSSAYTETVSSSEELPPGTYQQVFRFFTGGDSTSVSGDLTAEGSQTVTLRAGENRLPDVVLTGKVASLTVPALQSVSYDWDGQSQLVATAQNASGAVMAVDPGSFLWQTSSDLLKLQPDGLASGKRDTEATVTCTLDGKSVSGKALVGPTLANSGVFTPNYISIAEGTGEFHRWDRYPLRVYVDTDNLWTSGLETEFKSAAAEWESATEGKVKFVYTPSSAGTDWDIHVSFVPRSSFSWPTVGRAQWSGVVPVNSRAWIEIAGDFSGNRIAVAVHEIGHALGLTRHSTSGHDIMYFSISETSTLSQRDINTLFTSHGGSFPLGITAPRTSGSVRTESISCGPHDLH